MLKDRIIVNDELERMWMEGVIHFKNTVLSSAWWSEKNHEISFKVVDLYTKMIGTELHLSHL
jgi:hypothetical protein